MFSYHGCTLSLSGCYHVVQPDAISQPVPMTFIACLHAQLQSARESARAAAEGATSTLSAVPAFPSLNPAMSGPPPPNAAAVVSPSRVNPPRVMIAGGEKSGKCSLTSKIPTMRQTQSLFFKHRFHFPISINANFSSGKSAVAKILANYAVRMDQKPVRFCQMNPHPNPACPCDTCSAACRSRLCRRPLKCSRLHLRSDHDARYSARQFRGQPAVAQGSFGIFRGP